MEDYEEFRNGLIESIHAEIIGPEIDLDKDNNSASKSLNEIIEGEPLKKYIAGILFPNRSIFNEIANNQTEDDNYEEDSDLITNSIGYSSGSNDTHDSTNDSYSEAYDESIRRANEYNPSSIGMSFLSSLIKNDFLIKPYAAIYKKIDSDDNYRNPWQRVGLNLEPILLKSLPEDNICSYEIAENLEMRIFITRRNDNLLLFSIIMLNKNISTSSYIKSSECFFQVGFEVSACEDDYIFAEYGKSNFNQISDLCNSNKREDLIQDFLYRKRKTFAVGHGCAVENGAERDGFTNKLKTVVFPQYKVHFLEPRKEGGDELSMYVLSGAEGKVSPDSIVILLKKLTDDYEKWITFQESGLSGMSVSDNLVAGKNIINCRECLERIKDGISLLSRNEKVMRVFMLANEAMLMQQYHSRRKNRKINDNWEDFPVSYGTDSKTGRWYAFQLAFILMNLPSLLSNPEEKSSYNDYVDLVWFPTGGGKTEAYLCLIACFIFFRRMNNNENAGCSVLMRYTLRLLTSQQFQRASSLICACEIIRRNNPDLLGAEQISIGLWVGDLTPGKRGEAIEILNKMNKESVKTRNPFLVLKCPWCGTSLDDKEHYGYIIHKFSSGKKTVIFVCQESRCHFSRYSGEKENSLHLPVYVIDEDIYDNPPSLLIGTVDKFAMIAWNENSGKIFGKHADKNYDPPDLIIQDELHLISGPLGSIVGLYESAIELLCSWKGKEPKIITSTATISRSSQQCKSLYGREVFVFPPQCIDISDTFFASENKKDSGRVYIGVFPTNATILTSLVRILGRLFQSCKSNPIHGLANERVRDPYWTVIQYFNSLRELGHALSLVEADIPEYLKVINKRRQNLGNSWRYINNYRELTSRCSADEIPEILQKLDVSYPEDPEAGKHPLDTLLATNMISVGIHIDRLGCMVINGQPKTTSEYIQASSRVGRSFPGLVLTILNPGKPRDRSHYENFIKYHSAFYRYVEPTSVTPFSLPVLERALHAVFIILVRHFTDKHCPSEIDFDDEKISEISDYLIKRCKNIDPRHSVFFEKKLKKLIGDWKQYKPKSWGGFSANEDKPLMYLAGDDIFNNKIGLWPTLTSMRNVDRDCEGMIIKKYES
ncbi:MAG: hypothetical protein JXA60_08170 [Candidatus Coatesbacteria bacterium]|nr:hypothetical protein [Candidatus Coatesbacteria bacterium]